MWKLLVNGRRKLMRHLLCVALILFSVQTYAQLTESEFNDIRENLTPDKSELWRTIPWKLSVIEAQKMSVQSKKPIFIWSMDGHPLACV